MTSADGQERTGGLPAVSASADRPPARAPLRARPEHGWVWAVVPAGAEWTGVSGDAELERLLGEVTWPAAGPARDEESHVTIFSEGASPDGLPDVPPEAEAGRVVAAAIGDPRPSGRRAGRLAARISAPIRTRARAGAWEQAMRERGLSTVRIPTGHRWRAHRLGGRALMPAGEIVVGHSGERRASLMDAVAAAASRDLGTPLTLGPMTVRGSGILLAELRGGERDLILRVGVGPGAQPLRNAARNLEELHSVAPSWLGDRLPAPLATGRVGSTT
jgi:hypothetical protein